MRIKTPILTLIGLTLFAAWLIFEPGQDAYKQHITDVYARSSAAIATVD